MTFCLLTQCKICAMIYTSKANMGFAMIKQTRYKMSSENIQTTEYRKLSNMEIFKTWQTHRRHSFRNVRLCGKSKKHGKVSILVPGICFSEFESGPNLQLAADVMFDLFGSGSYGVESSDYIGFDA